MIVYDGRLLLLQSQIAYLETLEFGLYTNDLAPVPATEWADIVEAAWGGYARAGPLTWSVPVIVANRAQSIPTALPSFTNTSGAPQTFYGWFVVDPAIPKLVLAVRSADPGPVSLPNGGTYALSPGWTDTQE